MEQLNLKLTLNSNGSITARWSAVSNVTKYKAYMFPVGKSYAIYNETELHTTSYTSPADLAANQQYKVVLEAVRSSGGNLSDGAQILIPSDFYDNQTISTPQNVNATADTVSVTVSFTAVAHARSYDILFDNKVTNITTTSKRFTGLQPKTNHTYAVRAKTSKTTSAYSTTKTIKTLAISPSVPSGIKKAVTETTATISWNTVSGATGYDILFNGSVYSTTATSRKFTGLTAGKSYTFQVRAKNADATSAYTVSNTVTTAPKAPASISATSTNATVTITWGKVTGATGYIVRFNNTDVQCSASATSYTAKGLAENTSYSYQICSKSADGSGSFSTSRTIKTQVAPPAVPSGIKKSATETTATISWNAVSGATGYDVLFNGSVYSVTGTSKQFTRLTAGKAYAFQVRSKKSGASSAYTASATVTTAPKAPSTISATSTDTTATITWGKVTGATGYIVRFNNTDIQCTASATSYTVTGLTPKTSYNYQICSKSADGFGSFSTSRSIKTQAQLPTTPTGISHQSTDNSATVSWNAVSGATGYDIYFNGTTYSVTTTSKTFANLAANVGYTYKVRAKNADGISNYSNVYTVRTTPKAPTASGISGATGENSATVNWNAVTGAESYDVLFNGTVQNVKTTSATFTGLTANTSYSYQIRVRTKDGASSYSTAKTIRTAPTAPASPTVNATQSAVTISWGSVSGATSYDLIFNGTTYRVSGTYKTISGLSAGTNYTYQIRSNNADGSGSYSAVKTITTIPNAPTRVSATATVDSVTVSWTAASGATGYEVYMNNKTYTTSGTSIKITGLASNTSYAYRVRSKNASGYSAYTSSQTVRTLLKAPDTPTGVTASATYNSVTIRWNSAVNATGYDVLFNGTVYNATGNSKTISGLSASTNYSYRVRAKNSAGSSAYSATATIKTPIKPPATPTGIKATATESSVTVSWNAVSTAASYELAFNGNTYTLTGTSRAFTGLTAGTEYKYKVRAKNAGGYSAYSTENSITTIPSVPKNVTATVTATTMEVGWDAVKGAVSYTVRRNDRLSTVADTSVQYVELLPYTNYTYQVCAKNASGESAYSELKTVRTLLETPDADAEVTINSVSVSWDPVEHATSYDVQFDGDICNVSGTSAMFTDLIPETEHTYAVCARNGGDTGFYCREKTVKTLRAVPDVPDIVWADPYYNSVVLTWFGVPDATGYEVEFDGVVVPVSGSSRAAAPKLRKAYSVRSSGLQRVVWEIAGLLPNTEHTYRVRATNIYGAGGFSELQSVTTKTNKRNGMPSGRRRGSYPDGRMSYTGLDPVNAVTGSFLWSNTILEEYGKDALNFTVMYDSQRDEHETTMGKGWTHALNYLLYKDADYYYFSTPYDEVTSFRIEEGNAVLVADADSKSDYRLEIKEDNSVSITDLDGTEYRFNSALQITAIWENGLQAYWFETDAQTQTVQIKGVHGGSIALVYEDGYLIKAENALGNVAMLTYENGKLASVTNPAGDRMTFEYDGCGRLAKIGDFSGNIYLENQYDSQGRVVIQTMADRGVSGVSYADGCTSFTDEAGNITNYHYNEAGNVTEIELEGTSTCSSYNERGQMVEQVDALGNKTQMGYDDKGRMNLVTHPDQTTEQVFYNDRNQPVRIINRDGTEIHYAYDERNNLVSVQDERGNTSIYAYDSKDNLISYMDKEGNKWQYLYDENQHLCEALDPEGKHYLYVHDAIGRLTSYTTPAGRETTYEYSATGELLKIVDADGSQIFAYDGNGNCTSITDRMGNSQRLEYNAMGQVVLATDYMGKEYRFTYDERGNLLTETDPLGYQTEYAYDAFGNRVSQKDKNDGIKHFYFDAENRLTKVKDAAGGTVSYTYNNMGEVTAVTDPLDHQRTFAYDQAGHVISETDALGHSISYTYDQVGNILTRTDEDGVVTTYGYDKESRLVSIETAAGTTTFTYDALDRVISVLDVDGYTEQAQYDGDGNMVLSSDKESRQTSYVYDSMGRLAEETAPNGGKTVYAYDKNGNCTQITDAEGHIYAYVYDANNRLTMSTDPAGNSTAYEFDDRGQLVRITDARGGITQYAYDGNGNVVKETNPVGGEKSYTYDSLNRLTCITDEMGHSSTYTYDAAGNRISYTDANGNQCSYAYDANNRLISIIGQDEGSMTLAYSNTGKVVSITDMEGAETSYQYDSMGRLTEMSDALGNSLSLGYDSVGHLVSQTDANGNTTEYEYSPAGNLISITDAEGGVTAYTYNEVGQVLTETDALGNAITYAYDLLGQVTSMTDALGNTTTFTYTADGQIQTVQNAEGEVTKYFYDACGNLSKTEDALGNIVLYEYDAMNNQIKECMDDSGEQVCATLYQYDKKGRMIKEILPLLDEKVYNYDGNDNLVSFTDEEGQKTTVRYDLNNQPTAMTYSDGRTASFRYNKRGELVEMQDWNGTATMERDVLGRLVKVTDHNGRETGFSYDAAGNRTGISYPDGAVAAYAYDKNNRLTKVTDSDGQVAQYAYDNAGNVLSLTQPGSVSTYTYNANRQPVKAVYSIGENASVSEAFTYDALGRIIGSERTGSAAEFARSAAYAYDAKGQLVTYRNGQNKETYAYDALGNRTTKSLNGIQKATYQYNQLNQLTAMTEDGAVYGFVYDRCGNLTEERRDGSLIRQYAYDTAGMMATGRNLESGEETAYTYNALRMRVKNVRKLAAGDSIRTREMQYVPDFLGAPGNELMSYETGAGNIRNVFGHGYTRLSRTMSEAPEGVPGKAYFQSDIYGSLLLAADAQGNLLQYAERNIWGDLKPGQEMTSGLEESLRFTSYSLDPVIGRYFAQARFYDSRCGRMLSPDPVKRGLNRYHYCDNDPVNYEDSTGEIANILIGGALGAITGGAFGFGGSVVSQLIGGQKVDWRKAAGAAANGAITGGVKGALIGSGAGIPVALAADFAAGTMGSAAEQWISGEDVSIRRSVTDGLTNAVSGAIYENNPMSSLGSAVLRGAGAGAANAGINYISDALGSLGRGYNGGYAGALLGMAGSFSPYAYGRDPRSGCGGSRQTGKSLGYTTSRGYQYDVTQTKATKSGKKYSLKGFIKETLLGGVMGGLSSAAFYGGGKAVESLKRGIQGRLDRSAMDYRKVSNDYFRTGERMATTKQVRKYKKQWQKRGIKVVIDRDCKQLEGIHVAGFDYEEGAIYLQKTPAVIDLYHEGYHAEQYLQIGKESYIELGRLAREEHVYRRIMKNSDLFNESELEGATKYIMDLRRRAVKNGLFESRGN